MIRDHELPVRNLFRTIGRAEGVGISHFQGGKLPVSGDIRGTVRGFRTKVVGWAASYPQDRTQEDS
jgi:hypothetical protein